MGVYIKGMELPTNKFGRVLLIYPNGEVVVGEGTKYEAIPVPPHDRLVEYHAAVHAVYNGYKDFGLTWRNAEVMLGKLPTIIPAEEGE